MCVTGHRRGRVAPGGPGDRQSIAGRHDGGDPRRRPDAAGLDDLARHDGYIARQLKRWHGQWAQQRTRELPLVDEVHDALAARIPEQGPGTIVHGDYRLDNTIVSADGNVAAVLDWEICTLGDPLADLGVLMVYWTGPTTSRARGAARRRRHRASGTVDELPVRYAELSGRDVSDLGFYVAFGYWKLGASSRGCTPATSAAPSAGDPAELAPFARRSKMPSARRPKRRRAFRSRTQALRSSLALRRSVEPR